MSKFIKRYKSKNEILDNVRDYVKLREAVTKEGILNRSYVFYVFLKIFILGGFFLSAYLIFIAHFPLYIILAGFLFAFFAVQIGGLIHDAGHRAMYKTTLWNDIWGYIFSALVGAGYSAWKDRHNTHHAHPNQEQEDPDIELPFHSFTVERYKEQKGIGRLLRRYQAWLFFPTRSLAFYSMRYTAVKYFVSKFEPKILWEIGIFIAGLFVWFVLPFLLFGFVKGILLFFVVSITMGLYLSNIFAPNHKGMPEISKDTKLSFMEQQIITSRNIYGNWLTDFLYMGLNYQIEHHLFPNTPRNKLRLITPYVKILCKRNRLPYTSVSFVESNKIIISELQYIASSA